MRKTLSTLLFLCCGLFTATAQKADYNVVPLPQETRLENGAGFAIRGATAFPSMRAIALSGKSEYAYEIGVIAAKEAMNAGYHWTFAPCVDILGNAYNPPTANRSAGDNAEEVIEYCGAYMSGLQDTGLIATLKHFPGDGYSHDDQHVTVTHNPLSRKEWDERGVPRRGR